MIGRVGTYVTASDRVVLGAQGGGTGSATSYTGNRDRIVV